MTMRIGNFYLPIKLDKSYEEALNYDAIVHNHAAPAESSSVTRVMLIHFRNVLKNNPSYSMKYFYDGYRFT